MKDFTFDLQRFANVWQIGSEYYSSLSGDTGALANANDGDTITLLQDTTENALTISKNVTIDLGRFTYTIYRSSSGGIYTPAFTVSSATVTFKNGTLIKNIVNNNIAPNKDYLIVGTGNVIVEDLKTERTGTSGNIYLAGGTVTVKGDSSLTGRNSTYVLDSGNNVQLAVDSSNSINLTTTSSLPPQNQPAAKSFIRLSAPLSLLITIRRV